MCGRYTYFSSEDLLKKFNFENKQTFQQALEFKDNYNVTPGSEMPVIIRGAQAHRVEFMIWGLVPSWSKDPNMALKLINARSESLLEKPMWKRLVKSKRCVVPARGFYEWKKDDDGKTPYYITPKNREFFNFAGLWDEWHDGNGNEIVTYTIITTSPNEEMKSVHNRMPAILDDLQMEVWLGPESLSQAQIDDLLAPFPNGSLKIFEVSKDVNSPKHNSVDLIYPLED